MGVLALYWWTDWGLLLCSGLIANDHGYKIGFRYVILRWINNWERIVQIVVDMLGWLLPFILGW